LTPLIVDDDDSSDVGKDEFTCNMPGVPVDSSNLVLRALELMRRKTGVQQYFNANLIKQVPAQAGLGGGSANAATAMWGANTLMGNPATLEQVRYSALKLMNQGVHACCGVIACRTSFCLPSPRLFSIGII
jgi:4-diphosphocytidyl-2C-methyl-D-erythritol kinase